MSFEWAQKSSNIDPRSGQAGEKVGRYTVDYSEPDADTWICADPELEALFSKSNVISEKSDS